MGTTSAASFVLWGVCTAAGCNEDIYCVRGALQLRETAYIQ